MARPRSSTATKPVVDITPINAPEVLATTPAPVQQLATTVVPAETIDLDVLRQVIAATEAGTFLCVEPSQAKAMEIAGYVECGWGQAHDEAGYVGTRAIDVERLKAVLAFGRPSAAPGAVTKVVGEVGIRRGIPIPVTKRKPSSREAKYPFEALEIGDSFHLLKTEDTPDPKRTVSSTVSLANRAASYKMKDASGEVILEDQSFWRTQKTAMGEIIRDANGDALKVRVEKIGPKLGYRRRFIVKDVDASDPDGIGARVFRINPEDHED